MELPSYGLCSMDWSLMGKEPRYKCPRGYKTRTPSYRRTYTGGGFRCCCVISPSRAPKEWCPGDVIMSCFQGTKDEECESMYLTPDEATTWARALLSAADAWIHQSSLIDIVRDDKQFTKVLYQARRKK